MKLTTKLLTFTASVLLAVGGQAVAQTPKDQIALQLGAIQMGYTVPFAVSANSTATQKQQAVNSLVMGRNAMNATVSLPAATVKGVVKSPSVNTADYRDQLYSAVEYVVTSPVSASINGTVVMSNNATVTVNATALRAAAVSNDWMTPVPYALEARSSVDTQALREELVAAGVLKQTPSVTAPTFVFYAPATPGGANGDFVNLVTSTQRLTFRKTNTSVNISFDAFIANRLTNGDRILIYNYDLLAEARSFDVSGLRTELKLTYPQRAGDTAQAIGSWIAIPTAQGALKSVLSGGFTVAVGTAITSNAESTFTYNGTPYTVYQLFNAVPAGTTLSFRIMP